MSWDAHVQTIMAAEGMKQAGIFSLDGQPWGLSPGFAPTDKEIKFLIQILKNKEKGKNGSEQPITVCGQKYMFIKPEESGLLTVMSLGGGEKYACTVCASQKAAVVGVIEASMAGSGRMQVDKYKNYLESIGY